MICVDVSCSKNPGPFQYRGLDMEKNGEVVFEYSYVHGTNNIGEFLAVVHALIYCKKHGITREIYTDSNTALAWIRNSKCKTTLPEHEDQKVNMTVRVMLSRAEDFLKNHRPPNEVKKWDTQLYGDTPADYDKKGVKRTEEQKNNYIRDFGNRFPITPLFIEKANNG